MDFHRATCTFRRSSLAEELELSRRAGSLAFLRRTWEKRVFRDEGRKKVYRVKGGQTS